MTCLGAEDGDGRRRTTQDDRTEQPAHRAGPVALDGEQADQDDQRDRHDEVREARVDDVEALDGRDDRDRRGDHAVAEEQPGAEDAEGDQGEGVGARLRRLTSAVRAMIPPSPRLWARMMKPAYLIETTIISDQKISEAIPYTPAGVVLGRVGVGGEDRLDGVERARAEVAVDDAERAQCEHRLAGVGDDVPVVVRWRSVLSVRRVLGGSTRAHRPVAELVRGLVEAALGSRGRSRRRRRRLGVRPSPPGARPPEGGCVAAAGSRQMKRGRRGRNEDRLSRG